MNPDEERKLDPETEKRDHVNRWDVKALGYGDGQRQKVENISRVPPATARVVVRE